MRERSELSVPARMRRCALWGLAFGCAYSALATGIMVLGAVAGEHTGRLWAQLVALYLAGGLAGGAVVGLLWPIAAGSVLGEGVVGAVAIFPLIAGYLVTEHGWFPSWSSGDWTVALVSSALLGGLGGPQVASVLDPDSDE